MVGLKWDTVWLTGTRIVELLVVSECWAPAVADYQLIEVTGHILPKQKVFIRLFLDMSEFSWSSPECKSVSQNLIFHISAASVSVLQLQNKQSCRIHCQKSSSECWNCSEIIQRGMKRRNIWLEFTKGKSTGAKCYGILQWLLKWYVLIFIVRVVHPAFT